MNAAIVTLALLASATFGSDETPKGQSAALEKAPARRLGMVFVIGNQDTRVNVILRQVPLYPGQVLSYPDLRVARHNLEQLGIFKPGSVSVTAEDDPNNPASEYKNVFINVEETCTGSLTLMPAVSCAGKPALDLVWEERNFDPLRFPCSLDDLIGGGAFRGGGQMFRFVLLRIPVVP